MAYKNTFITVAPDCPVDVAETPTTNRPTPTRTMLEHRLLQDAPYSQDHRAFSYAVHHAQKGREAKTFDEFHSKGQPCMRASPLTKRYGWGAHYDDHGNIAIYPKGSDDYRRLSDPKNNLS